MHAVLAFLLTLSNGWAETPVPEIPPAVMGFVETRGGTPASVSRRAGADLGEYHAYRVSMKSIGPGDPGEWILYAHQGQPMLERKSDWSGFLRAAAPDRVAKALSGPLDTLVRAVNAKDPAYMFFKELQVISDAEKDPVLKEDGTLVFYVIDGQGDPPSEDVYRIAVRAKPEGGLDIQRTWMRPTK